MTERRYCFYNDECAGIVKVIEGVDGYLAPDPALTLGMNVMSITATELNESLGLTPEDVEQIVQSSMFPKGAAAKLARERYNEGR